MPITVEETRLSRKGNDDQRQRRFLVRGTDDDHAALQAARSAIGAVLINGMVLEDIDIDTLAEHPPIFEAVARYRRVISENELVYNFDLSLENVRVKRSLRTIASYAEPGKTAPDFHQAINVQHDQKIEGADIALPVAKFSYSATLEEGRLTEAYAAYLETFVGKYNSVQFRQRPPGEVMFLGATGSQKYSGESRAATLDFHFHRRPNRNNITIGNITGINVKGWQYLWVYYQDDIDDDAAAIIPTPTAVYVEDLADPADLNQIFRLP